MRAVIHCPDCAVAAGGWHRPGCSFEICPYCAEPLLGCDCLASPPLDDRIPWSGCCPWLTACLRFGFFERRVEGRWVACEPGELGAEPDLNRLRRECRWSRLNKRFVLRRRARR
jgi:hypothetical protein